MIGSGTRLIALLGDPVAHSLSPIMHNSAFAALGLDMVYVAFRVDASELERAIGGLAALGAVGANVTIPYKRAAAGLASPSEDAAMMKAANTLVFRGPRDIQAYNTDVGGIERALAQVGRWPVRGPALVLGAGGAARAAVWALSKAGTGPITIAARDCNRARELSHDLGVSSREVPFELADSIAASSALVVNATAIGRHPGELGADVLAAVVAAVDPTAVVADFVYRPGGTQLESDARERGLAVADGLSILLHQGALSFELWTGTPAPVDVMRRALDGGMS